MKPIVGVFLTLVVLVGLVGFSLAQLAPAPQMPEKMMGTQGEQTASQPPSSQPELRRDLCGEELQGQAASQPPSSQPPTR